MSEILDDAEILLIVEKEYDEVRQTSFWKRYMDALKKERDVATMHCETDRDDVRFYQGGVRMADAIKDIPDRIMKHLRQQRRVAQNESVNK